MEDCITIVSSSDDSEESGKDQQIFQPIIVGTSSVKQEIYEEIGSDSTSFSFGGTSTSGATKTVMEAGPVSPPSPTILCESQEDAMASPQLLNEPNCNAALQETSQLSEAYTFQPTDSEGIETPEILITAFVDKCRMCSKESSAEDMYKLNSKIMKKYKECSPLYAESEEFRELLQDRTAVVTAADLYIHAKDIIDQLVFNKLHIKKARKELAELSNNSVEPTTTGGISKCTITEEKEVRDSDEEIEDRRTRKKLKKLRKTLLKLQMMINILEEREVDWDDEEDSSYMQTDRFKKKCTEVYKKICELKNQPADAGRNYLRKVTFTGTPYPEVNKAIEKWYNKHREFPDFLDIRNVIAELNDTNSLGMTPDKIHVMAENAFQLFGEELKRRRMCDDWDMLTPFMKEDPSVDDPLLKQKLEDNITKGKKVQDIIDEFALKEKELKASRKLKDEDIENEVNSSDEEEEDDEHDNDDAANVETGTESSDDENELDYTNHASSEQSNDDSARSQHKAKNCLISELIVRKKKRKIEGDVDIVEKKECKLEVKGSLLCDNMIDSNVDREVTVVKEKGGTVKASDDRLIEDVGLKISGMLDKQSETKGLSLSVERAENSEELCLENKNEKIVSIKNCDKSDSEGVSAKKRKHELMEGNSASKKHKIGVKGNVDKSKKISSGSKALNVSVEPERRSEDESDLAKVLKRFSSDKTENNSDGKSALVQTNGATESSVNGVVDAMVHEDCILNADLITPLKKPRTIEEEIGVEDSPDLLIVMEKKERPTPKDVIKERPVPKPAKHLFTRKPEPTGVFMLKAGCSTTVIPAEFNRNNTRVFKRVKPTVVRPSTVDEVITLE